MEKLSVCPSIFFISKLCVTTCIYFYLLWLNIVLGSFINSIIISMNKCQFENFFG